MIYPFIFILGLIFGSFLNVLADRLSKGKTIFGRSKCDSCAHDLGWYDLIPIVSFLMLKGKCRYCKASFSVQYPIAEIFTGVIFTLTWFLSTEHLLFPQNTYIVHVLNIAITAVLIVMLFSDLRYHIIPDEMQIALFIFGAVKLVYVSFIFGSSNNMGIFQMFGMQLLYGLIVMSPLLLVFLITKGRGMGFGDVKLAFVIGMMLGLISGFLALYIGFIIGGIVGSILLLTKKVNRKTKIAFGPFLILGLYSMIFFENEIILLISRIYGF